MAPSPEIVEYIGERAGIYFRSIMLPKAGMRVAQHVHPEAHATLVGCGRARLYVNGAPAGEVPAGHAVTVESNKVHEFEALEDNTRLTCVWSVEAAERMKETAWLG